MSADTTVPTEFDIATLQNAYMEQSVTPLEVTEAALARADSDEEYNVWIDRYDDSARARAAELSTAEPAEYPLYGIPFAVKDNIDVAGNPTTVGCPSYEYTPDESATVVDQLLEAGGILLGKTNMDQFATGLVGTRSPYGACRNAQDSSLISGGSSSGSGVAVARGQVSFALGTDTAGSGRVPAALNGIIGYKPTRGLISTNGVVPACRTLDCVSVFAPTVADARRVGTVLVGHDDADPYSRPAVDRVSLTGAMSDSPTVGVFERTEHFGDEAAAELFETAVARVEELGATVVSVPEQPFRETAELLYSGPWVAERFSAVGGFIKSNPDAVHQVVGEIIREGMAYSAVETFEAMYELQRQKDRIREIYEDIDVLLTPTTGTTYTIEEVTESPRKTNSNLGHYTDYVNLLDLSAIAVPSGARPDGAQLGVTLVGQADDDASLFALADRFVLSNKSPIPSR